MEVGLVDPIRVAIVQHLLATPAVTSLLGAPNNVFHGTAPAKATPPYVVLHRQAGTPEWTFDGPPLENDLWTIKGICRGSSAGQADAIDAALVAALTDAALPVAGYALLYLRWESKVGYPERDDGEIWHHSGRIYRVKVDPV
jgi:Protein of unknown function (DUF3168)